MERARISPTFSIFIFLFFPPRSMICGQVLEHVQYWRWSTTETSFFGLGPKPIPKNCQNVETRKFKLGHFLKILYTSTHMFDVKGTKLKWKVSVSAKKKFRHTVSNVCSTDWPKKDIANFESQNFEGKAKHWKKFEIFFSINFTQIFRICPKNVAILDIFTT